MRSLSFYQVTELEIILHNWARLEDNTEMRRIIFEKKETKILKVSNI